MDGKFAVGLQTRMTLAKTILLFGICSAGLSAQQATAPARATQQSGSDSSSNTQSSPEQNGTVGPPAAQEAKPSPPAAPQSTTKAKHHSGKKKGTQKAASNTTCDTANANPGSSPTASEAPATAGGSQTQGSGNAPAKNCPPEKVIVRQGGTAEPSIQLAGGDQTSKKRNEATQSLGSAEANLKKIAELQLSAAQQDTVSQIRQYVQQSKSALADGDVERGYILAWKAQLLSEDLVKPPQ